MNTKLDDDIIQVGDLVMWTKESRQLPFEKHCDYDYVKKNEIFLVIEKLSSREDDDYGSFRCRSLEKNKVTYLYRYYKSSPLQCLNEIKKIF